MFVWFFVFCGFRAEATPNCTLKIDEEWVGSNQRGYAILRTEKHNTCSYYSWEEKIFLDEYKKDGELGELEKSTQLSEVIYSIDAEHTDPNTLPEISENVILKNHKILWAEILQKYPYRTLKKWDSQKMERAEIADKSGDVRFDENIYIIVGDLLIEKRFKQKHEKAPWRLETIAQDMNCLYLKIGKGYSDDDVDDEIRIVCISIPKNKRNLG
jgi:hypothetical protein